MAQYRPEENSFEQILKLIASPQLEYIRRLEEELSSRSKWILYDLANISKTGSSQISRE